ncbi:uncharacterized protein [Danio rerio]|uniref:Uncharacterized protein n=1 Tax=Danio rerio TaxID=7955 RepID=A0AC58GNC0_DANRE
MSSSSIIEDFFAFPLEILLERCTKEELLLIAERFDIDVTSNDKKLKETLMKAVKSALCERGVLEVRAPIIPDESVSSPVCSVDLNAKFSEMSLQEKQLCVDAEKFRAERDVCALKEKELENDFEVKKMQQQLEMRKMELELQKEREEREFQLRKLELELKLKSHQAPVISAAESNVFDVHKNIRLVPPFLEREVEKYFQHFERVAESLKWPKTFWTLLLQCVLIGRAQDVYSALTTEQSSDYEIVKSAILQAYELAPEAYRQKFRTHFKSEKSTFLEFAREKENLFDRWCSSVKIKSKEELRELILLEEFKCCVPNAVAMYLNEHKVTKLSEAALMADEFTLTHQNTAHVNDMSRLKLNSMSKSKKMLSRQHVVSVPAENVSLTRQKGEIICFYCKKQGHKISDCAILKKKDKSVKPVGLISKVNHNVSTKQIEKINISEMEDKTSVDFGPFITDGSVSLPDSDEFVPVRILRDTGAGQSFLMQGLLPLSERTATGSHVLVRGLEMSYMEVPLHHIHLNSKLVTGDVVVGVRANLPIPGVTFILGNDLAGGNVWEKPDGEISPVVFPSVEGLNKPPDCSDLFPACAVTRAMTKRGVLDETGSVLSDTFISSTDSSLEPGTVNTTTVDEETPVHNITSVDAHIEKPVSLSESPPCDANANTCLLSPLHSVTRAELIKAQHADEAVQEMFSLVGAGGENKVSTSYILRDGLLCRQQPMSSDSSLDPRIQIVVPSIFRHDVLRLSHQGPAGHTGYMS